MERGEYKEGVCVPVLGGGGQRGACAERLITAVFRDPVVAGQGPSRIAQLSELREERKKKKNYTSNTLVSKDFR